MSAPVSTPLVALVEAYPDLKASENFRDLHNKLVDTENQMQFARRYYNGAVNLFNNRIQRFPDLVIAQHVRLQGGGVLRPRRSEGGGGPDGGAVMRAWRRIYKSVASGPAGLALGRPRSTPTSAFCPSTQPITVNADGSLDVREAIRVRAEGRKIRRGIYRDFPTIYAATMASRSWWILRSSPRSRDGAGRTVARENRGNGVRVYLGSPSELCRSASTSTRLVYRTDRQMGYFADHDELYWNVTGNGWDFAIDRATARVVLPAGDSAQPTIKLEAYTGPQGSKGQDYTAPDAGQRDRCSRPRADFGPVKA